MWWARVDDVRPGLDGLLSPADLHRRARSVREVDRARTTVAWAVARSALARRLGVPPRQVPVDRSCGRCGQQHGKPRLPPGTGLHVSVSHGGDLVVVAVAEVPVGVDVEPGLPAEEAAGVADVVLTPAELGRGSDLVGTWVVKEAALKAAGTGLLVGPDRVALAADGAVASWPVPGPVPWVHRLVPPAPDHAAALAGLPPRPGAVTEHDVASTRRLLDMSTHSSLRVPGATTRNQRYP